MKQTKIDWCDCTINPVVGCKNGCKFCYAEKMNKRFHYVKDWKVPEFFPERLEQLKSKKPKSIFMDSMSDIGCWEKEWCDYIASETNKNSQHNYIFLTKCYKGVRYIKKLLGNSPNKFYGVSITNQKQLNRYYSYNYNPVDFFSIEPILEPLLFEHVYFCDYVKFYIIGAETGNRKGKIVPKKEWIDNIVKYADEHGISVFMKESLRNLMGEDFRQDKLLWEK